MVAVRAAAPASMAYPWRVRQPTQRKGHTSAHRSVGPARFHGGPTCAPEYETRGRASGLLTTVVERAAAATSDWVPHRGALERVLAHPECAAPPRSLHPAHPACGRRARSAPGRAAAPSATRLCRSCELSRAPHRALSSAARRANKATMLGRQARAGLSPR